MHSQILSSGISLPTKIVKSDSLLEEVQSEKHYGIPHDWISNVMGIQERRMADEDTEPSDLAIAAGFEALDRFDGDPEEIDMVIFCGIERDHAEPATGHTIQNALGIHGRYTFDVSNACFGFMNGLEIADTFIKAGKVKYALIVTGEVPTRVLRATVEQLKKPLSLKEARAKIGVLSVGDAGGAVIVGPTTQKRGFKIFNHVTDSVHIDKCKYKVLPRGDIEAVMHMGPISNAIIRAHKNLYTSTMEQLGWDQFDWVLSHQMGQKPFDRIQEMTGVSNQRMIKTFNVLGNITSATFPVNFHKLINSGKVKTQDKIGGCFAGSGLAIGQFGYVN